MRIDIDTNNGNDAFSDDDVKKSEIVRILKNIIWKIEMGKEDGRINDMNGNKCGEWYI
jgi:hypothetical protein